MSGRLIDDVLYSIPKMRDDVERGIASLVCSAMYPGEHRTEFFGRDIETVRRMSSEELSQRGVPRYLHAKLVGQLDLLDTYLTSKKGEWARRLESQPQTLVFKALKPVALYSNNMRKCALAAMEVFGTSEDFNINDYLRVKDLFDQYKEHKGRRWKGPKEPTAREAYARLKERIADKRITEDRFDLLHTMFSNEDTAVSQIQHGPIEFLGRTFNHVYRLDVAGVDLKGKDRNEIKATILKRWEAKNLSLHDCFFDRLYIEYKGDLYLALSERGSVTRGDQEIKEDEAIEMRSNGRINGVGRVVHRQEAVNTRREAWLEGLRQTRDFFTGDHPLKNLEDAEAKQTGKPSTNIPMLMLRGASTFLIGADFLTGGIATAAVVGAVAVAATGRSVYQYYKASHQDYRDLMRPVYSAVGLALA